MVQSNSSPVSDGVLRKTVLPAPIAESSVETLHDEAIVSPLANTGVPQSNEP